MPSITRTSVMAGPAALLAACLSLGGCSGIEKAGPQPTPSPAAPRIELDVPLIMRGTIASEAITLGFTQPGVTGNADVLVRGWGLVVGLRGTGSNDVPPDIRAHMLREMAAKGVGQASLGFDHLSPEQLLDSPDTAVVVVEAIIPGGAPAGTRFDVRVRADPVSGTTSLEGGRLYTTELRPEPGALRVGAGAAFPLAEASGPLFINPFAEPHPDPSRDTINRTVGRVLNGGRVIKDLPVKLRLVNPSHARAAQVQSAINTRFPQEPGQRDPTARGESAELIQLTVPPSYHGRTQEFVELVKHTTIRRVRPESVAVSVRRALEANPAFAAAAALRWEALGQKALPIVRDVYDSADDLVRLAALTAGARLDDPLAIPSLIDMTRSDRTSSRLQAIELLASLGLHPKVDEALRELLDDPDKQVRIAAWRTLERRADPFMRRVDVDGRFALEIVESKEPMVLVVQDGQPRIVLFGSDLKITTPLTLDAWSSRLMVKGSLGQEEIEVYYLRPDAPRGEIHRVDPRLSELIPFLGHQRTIDAPQPGLGLTFSETVGALHQIWRAGYLKSGFETERDGILAAILAREQAAGGEERSEFGGARADEGPAPAAPPLRDAEEDPLGIGSPPPRSNPSGDAGRL
jgi:hypothetical protein